MTFKNPTSPVLGIIWHSRTGAGEALAKSIADGAGEHALLLRAEDVTAGDLLPCDGFAFVCPENLGTMSGMMKEMFDRCYYPLLGKVEGKPYASVICAGSDGTGAQGQLDRIVTGWRLKRVTDQTIVLFDAQTPEAILAPKAVMQSDLDKCRDLGAGLTEGLRSGIF
ncbi:MAG: NAD(P)H-dependent oxidoreductase [Pseudomonadota bacterium]